MIIPQKYVDNFWAKVTKTDNCWVWTAAQDRDGYGIYTINSAAFKKWSRAHRLSYELSVGPIPKGLVVMHACDNPCCVNPAHLSLGSVADNNSDKLKKNRQGRAIGTRNRQSKLTDAQVLDIKQRAIVGSRVGRSNGSNIAELAKEYQVCNDTIRLIARNKIWKHVSCH